MPEPLTVGAVLRWLATVQRTYGPDVPLLLVAPGRQALLAPRVPIEAMVLGLEAGRPAVVLRAGAEAPAP